MPLRGCAVPLPPGQPVWLRRLWEGGGCWVAGDGTRFNVAALNRDCEVPGHVGIFLGAFPTTLVGLPGTCPHLLFLSPRSPSCLPPSHSGPGLLSHPFEGPPATWPICHRPSCSFQGGGWRAGAGKPPCALTSTTSGGTALHGAPWMGNRYLEAVSVARSQGQPDLPTPGLVWNCRYVHLL